VPELTVAANITGFPTAEGLTVEVSVVVVAVRFTVCENTADVEPALFASPLYTTVIECAPRTNVEVEYEAAPLVSVTVANTAAPSRNWTVPVAVDGVTVALRVTFVPTIDGFADDVTVVLVTVFALTTWLTIADVERALAASPLYTAVIECVPCASVALENDAVPPDNVTVLSTAAPSRNWIVPVAVDGVTVTLKLTFPPTIEGFELLLRPVVVAGLFTVCWIEAEVEGAKLVSPL
jgi:hypothetical protein